MALVLASTTLLWSQEARGDLPPWVLYEQGMQLFEQGRYGEALRRFRAAAAERAPFPEAEIGIGRVFQAEGSLELALRQYETALEQAFAFEVRETEQLVRYRIADVHRLRGDDRAYVDQLTQLANQQEAFSDEALAERRAAYLNVLRSRGLDRLMVLYRIDDDFAHRAHRELGIHLYNQRDYDALLHLTFAAMQGFTRLVEELRRIEFDYSYSSATEVLADAREVSHLRQYLERQQFYRTLYYLGLALERDDSASQSALQIWRTLAQLPEAGQWYQSALQRVGGPAIRRR
ncbi:MAG: hypothetical protein EA404_08955 [Spirochaetaceae bacterium]|nr:MAG: hypothetical protein EA404_08955 [Spirochaetaceae bacterium]